MLLELTWHGQVQTQVGPILSMQCSAHIPTGMTAVVRIRHSEACWMIEYIHRHVTGWRLVYSYLS